MAGGFGDSADNRWPATPDSQHCMVQFGLPMQVEVTKDWNPVAVQLPGLNPLSQSPWGAPYDAKLMPVMACPRSTGAPGTVGPRTRRSCQMGWPRSEGGREGGRTRRRS